MADGRSRAAVLVGPKRLEVEEFALPAIGREDGLLMVEAAGICGSDWAQYLGTQTSMPIVYPIIPGHEIVGRIDRIGSEAASRWGVREGDRVAVGMQIGTRGVYGLSFSTDQEPRLWGGYSEYMYLDRDSVLYKVPEGLSAELAALYVPISNGVRWAAYVPMLEPGDVVVVQGPGQQGLGCVVAALDAGASLVIATGTSADAARLEVARSLGAGITVDVDKENLVEVVRTVTGGRMADVVLDVSAGSTAPVVLALEMVRRGGQVVLAGLKEHAVVPGFVSDKIVLGGITIHGSSSPRGTRGHDPGKPIRKALELIASGRYPLDLMCTHQFPLEQAEEAVQIIGRSFPGQDGIHVTICPGL
jgi:2-desacetyl-2-hydroxyethyl bacteriochlorophyllide A dehydrogenase